MYEDEHGSASSFVVTKIREAKSQNRFGKIKTRYCWESKELLTDEEYEQRFNKKPSTGIQSEKATDNPAYDELF